MELGSKILKLLHEQVSHYVNMKDAVQKQTAYIEAMDVARLTSGSSEVRGLMRKIRDLEVSLTPLRHSWGSLGSDRPVVEKRAMDEVVDKIRELIGEIQEVKDRNASMIKQSMVDVRKQLTDLNSQSKAVRAYFQRRPGQAARFVDKAR